MPIQFRDRLVRLEGTLERLVGGRPPREPLEIRRAVVESLTGDVRPVGGGRRVLPVGRVTVAIVATDATEKRLFKEALVGPDGVEADLRRALDAAGAEWPRGFSLTVKFVKAAGDDWRSGARFHVTAGDAGAPAPAAEPETGSIAAPAPAVAPTLVLRVTHGQAKPRTVTCDGERVNIGRQPTVADAGGRVVRRNDIAFIGEDEVSRSVSRAHAHVAWIPTAGTYRVFDEQSSHGTVVTRAGRLIQVPPGRDGLKLAAGDEVHVGRAVVVVEITPRS
ncbi:MAG: FHA domain-containing protein [Vicinamibacteraceae bacterium]